MQHIPLLFVCATIGGSAVGCASSMDELETEARECVDTSTNKLGITEEQRAACWRDVDERAEEEDRQLERRDELITYLNACDAHPGFIIVEVIRSGRSTLPNSRQKAKAKREVGYPYTHDNVSKWARKSDIFCTQPQTIMRQLGL